MTTEDFSKLMQDKIKEANLQQYTGTMTNIICDVHKKGFTYGMEIAIKLSKV